MIKVCLTIIFLLLFWCNLATSDTTVTVDYLSLSEVSSVLNQSGADQTVILPKGNYVVSDNLNLSPNISLQVQKGAKIQVAVGKTLTLPPSFQAGPYSIFSGEGIIKFSPNTKIQVVWFSSGGDGSESNPWVGAQGGGGIGEALSHTASDAGGFFELPTGKYLVTSQINLNRNGLVLSGQTHNLSNRTGSKVHIDFQPQATATLFKFSNTVDSYILWHCSVSGVYLTCDAGNNTAIELIDTSECDFRDIYISGHATPNWHGTGIDWQGRELGIFDRCKIRADRPIAINKNGRVSEAGSIDIDATLFRDMLLVSFGDKVIDIASGVNLTNVKFEGNQNWIGGKYGLYWVDTTSTICSTELHLDGIKSEQSNPTDGYSVYISLANSLYGLNISRCSDVSRNGGFAFLRNINTTHLSGVKYYGTGPSLNIDNCKYLKYESMCVPNYRENNIQNMTQVFRIDGGPYEHNAEAVYVADPDSWEQRVSILGTKHWSKKVTLNDEEILIVPGFYGSQAIIEVTTSKGTGDYEIGKWFVTPTHPNFTSTLVNGTVNTAAALVDGKICVYNHSGVAAFEVKNRLGEPREFFINVKWQ